MQKDNVGLVKLNLFTAITAVPVLCHITDSEQSRLLRWFPQLEKFFTSDRHHLLKSVTSYFIRNTKRKMSGDIPYDERFVIMVDNKFGGVLGLEGIDRISGKAEVWCFVLRNYEGCGVATKAITHIEKYVLRKGINTLCAYVRTGNNRSINLLNKNSYANAGCQEDFTLYLKYLSR